jgi:hypothetical protein
VLSSLKGVRVRPQVASRKTRIRGLYIACLGAGVFDSPLCLKTSSRGWRARPRRELRDTNPGGFTNACLEDRCLRQSPLFDNEFAQMAVRTCRTLIGYPRKRMPTRSTAVQALLVLLTGSVFHETSPAQTNVPRYEPRAKASDYAASLAFGPDGAKSFAAESLAHSVPVSGGGMLFAENHLVIEVAIYGPPGKAESIAAEHFSLFMNGKKIPLLPDAPGSVAAGMRDSMWNSSPNLEASGSVNGAGVILGRRRPQTGVPDIDATRRAPQPPRAPTGTGREPSKAPIDIAEELDKVSLSRCDCKLPTGGLLYFPFRGKLKSIKSMVLHYTPPNGDTVELKLAP